MKEIGLVITVGSGRVLTGSIQKKTWGAGNGLHLNLDRGNISVCTCKNPSSCALKIYALYVIDLLFLFCFLGSSFPRTKTSLKKTIQSFSNPQREENHKDLLKLKVTWLFFKIKKKQKQKNKPPLKISERVRHNEMETKKSDHQTQSKKTMPMPTCRDVQLTDLRQKNRSSRNQWQLANQQHL